MRPERLPDWLIWTLLVAIMVAASVAVQTRRKPPPRPGSGVGFPLAPATAFDPAVIAPTDAKGAGSGTAFSVRGWGVWLTARHVVEGCGQVVIVAAPGRGVAARTRIDPVGETAVLLTRGGAPALDLASPTALTVGQIAYFPGFPKGRAGEVAARLLRRETLVLKHRREPVLAWAEVGRTPFLWGSLAGLSGAPAVDETGRVIAVTVAQAPRRHRLYTTTPASLKAALAGVGAGADGLPAAVARTGDYHATSARLRGQLSVARVVCLAP